MMKLYTTGSLAEINITAKGIEVTDGGCGCCADTSTYSREAVLQMIDEEIAALQAARAALAASQEPEAPFNQKLIDDGPIDLPRTSLSPEQEAYNSALIREIAKREGIKIVAGGVSARECVIFFGCYKELGEPLPAALLRGVISKRRLKKAGMSKELLRDF